MNVVGNNEDPKDDEIRLLQTQIDLCQFVFGNGKSIRSSELAVKDEAELMQQCENKVEVQPVHDKTKQPRVRLECIYLLDSRELILQYAAYPEGFETVRPMVRDAVNIAMASLRMQYEVELMVPWINQKGNKSIDALRRELNENGSQRIKNLKSDPDMMRLVTCFIDFSVNDDILKDALRPRQPYSQQQ